MLFASSEAMAQAGQTVTSQDIQPGVTNGESMPPVPRARPENEGATQPSVRWPQVVVPERPADPFIDSLPPFGASLFESPGMAGGQGPHPDYQIDVGDQILGVPGGRSNRRSPRPSITGQHLPARHRPGIRTRRFKRLPLATRGATGPLGVSGERWCLCDIGERPRYRRIRNVTSTGSRFPGAPESVIDF